MKRKTNIAMIMMLSLLLITFLYQPQVWAAEPTISVNGSGIPGKSYEVIGNNFVPGEIIQLELVMDDLPILVGLKGKAIVVNDKGSFTGKTNYPHKLVAVPGMWDLTAAGDKGSEASCKIEIKKP
ncbi:hypothetical protein ACFL2E_06390 [Thermodesulfobacteriota bacterium]